MKTKYTFEDLSTDDTIFDIAEHPTSNLEDLLNEASSWKFSAFEPTQEILKEYFNTTAPIEVVRNSILTLPDLTDSIDILLEIYMGCESDTYVRELIIDAFCKFIGMENSWPINGDTDETKKKFFEEYKLKVKEVGAEYHV